MFVLDTNVVSEMRKVERGAADRSFAAWSATVIPSGLYLSVVTIMELEQGVLRLERRDAVQARVLRAWLSESVMSAFALRILPIDVAISRRWAQLQVPDPRSYRDTLIGATAFVHGMSVVTRNVSDFLPLGVDVVDPWRPLTDKPPLS